ncbi:DUF1501 domain-containing protein [Zavarzinella formosa]|uniref:DUF1501 domain-containing protein n=1 Tax=Zavarzinella formosa TaxID=360055 RepID=UPI0002D979BC|nr:DUF1501 domain-containing protein [Zavarzinella formosa]
MLRVLGSAKNFCDGLTRRDAMWVGGLNMLGLTLADHLRASTPPSADQPKDLSFGKAKNCILLYLYGSPSQLELADMKPDAPPEIRGELKAIRSSLPGCDVCELLPYTSRVMDRVTVLRSLTHKHPIHGVAYATTGIDNIDVAMELNPHDGRHWPFVGSVVSYLEQQKKTRKAVPDNIALPWPFSSRRTGEVQRAGPYAAYLGSRYHPHYTEFVGEATREITKTLQGKYETFKEPYVGIAPNGRFTLGDAATPTAEMTLDRLDRRKSLLAQFDDARRLRGEAPATYEEHRRTAYEMISTSTVRDALDISRESVKTRENYGMTVFGQASLAARRLVEAGSKFVTVFWDEFGFAGSGWDTHWEHYPRMKNELMPGFDRAFSGLILDLEQRGMLDDTLVVMLSEHGRTPKITTVNGGGRDHWAQAYTALFAGGGTARGRVVGKTDKIGGTVTDRPTSPKDVLATMYHLLGYDLETMLRDKTGRPVPIIPGGSVVRELLA